VVSLVLADNGDNLLGGLLASFLRGPHPSPSHNPKETLPIPLKLRVHAHSTAPGEMSPREQILENE